MAIQNDNTPTSALDKFVDAYSTLSAAECAEELRRHQYHVSEHLAIDEGTEDRFTISHSSTLKGIRWFLATQEYMESLLYPDEEEAA